MVNTYLKSGNNLYVKNWDSKGTKTIGDILGNNGNLFTFDTLKELYGVRCTFLKYQNFLHNIPNQWKNIINLNRVFIYQNRYNILEDFENASPYFCTFLANRICD